MGTVNVIRTQKLENRKLIWIAFSENQTLYGVSGESKKHLLERWRQSYGAITKLIRYEGIARPSEAAATICEVQGKLKR